MLYKYEDGKLNVFEMKIDCYELRNVRERILENCSIVMKCEGVFLEFYYNYFKNRRHFCKQRFDHTEGCNWYDRREYYKYTYDEYYFPEIVDVINDILNGNEERINDLFSTEDIKYNVYEYRNKIMENIVNLINDYKITNNRESIEEASLALENICCSEFNERNKSIKEYYPELIDCFSFIKIVSIDDLELKKISEYLGNNWQEKIFSTRNKDLDSIVNLIDDYKNTNTRSSIEEAKCILEKLKQIKKQNEKSENPYIQLINYLELRKDDLELEKLKTFLGNEWIEKMTNFSDYKENNRKLVTNQYVKKLMK